MSVEIARVDHYKANTYTVAPRGRLPLMLHVPVEPIVSILNWSNDPDCCQYGLPTITNMPTVEEGAVPVSPSSGFGYRPISGLHVSKKQKKGKGQGPSQVWALEPFSPSSASAILLQVPVGGVGGTP